MLHLEDIEMIQEDRLLKLEELKNDPPKTEEALKEDLRKYIDSRFDMLYENSKAMINSFHIEILRQFEI